MDVLVNPEPPPLQPVSLTPAVMTTAGFASERELDEDQATSLYSAVRIVSSFQEMAQQHGGSGKTPSPMLARSPVQTGDVESERSIFLPFEQAAAFARYVHLGHLVVAP